MSNKANGTIAINIASKILPEFKNIPLDQKVQDNIVQDNLSLKLVLIFFHKLFTSKKEDFTTHEDLANNSPNIIYNMKKHSIKNLVSKYLFEKNG